MSDERLIDLTIWTPDQRRQADVMVACDTWQSRTCGAWVEDYYAAFKTDAVFDPDMLLDFACSCDEEHALSLDLPCLFVDEYRDLRLAKPGDRIAEFLGRIDRRYGGPVTVGERFDIETPIRPVAAIRLETADGFAVVQRRYLDAGTSRGVEAWTLAGMQPRSGQTSIVAIVVGERAGEVVALVMPMIYRDEDGNEAIGGFDPATVPQAPTPAAGGGA